MTPAVFSVFVTSHFAREFKKLSVRHPALGEHYRRVVAILQSDPFNLSRVHPIKKLTGVPAGEGQWRIRAERFRFRYDVDGPNVFLKACVLRDESTYR